ncbi:MAG: LysE family translocator [Acidisphaera sp.]|nr:LysE family translocator [Acidisphaera sp.]
MDTSALSYIGFAIAASITPGPNNALIAASAANHGVRRALPHVLGIGLGFAAMLGLVAIGLTGSLAAHPRIYTALRLVAVAWLLVLAWQIARTGAPGRGPARPPLGFFGAALFQWVNPKAWLLAFAAATTWTDPTQPLAPQVVWLAGVFGLVCVPCALFWALLGSGASRLLVSTARLRAFNIGMGVLLVASVLPALWE